MTSIDWVSAADQCVGWSWGEECLRMDGKVTAADVARRADVSRSTVSRAFSPGRPVDPSTRARILKAARELGYEPDGLAKALISGRSGIVGILMGELTNPIHAAIHQTLSFKLQRGGLIPVSAQLGEGSGIAEVVAMFRRYRADAVVLTSMNVTQPMIAACRSVGLRVLLLNRVDGEGAVASICADVEQGGRLAATHLAQAGHRRVALAQGVPGSWTATARLTGHRAGLDAAGLVPAATLPSGYGYDDGLAGADALVAATVRPTAILCPNDLYAIGLMDRLRKVHGVRIPDDLAVVGFDDIPMAAWSMHDLTTVRLPVERMTGLALAQLTEMAGADAQLMDRTWVPCRLVRRGSA